MKVAVLTQYFPDSHQPWAGHSAYQTVRLLAQQCQLKVFYPEATYPRWFTPSSRIYPPVDPAYQPPGVAVEYIPYPVLPLVSRPFNGWAAARRLLPHIRQFHPDILLNYTVYPDGFAAVSIGRTLRIPVILAAIGSDLNRLSDPFCAALTRRALRKADFTLTVSGDLLTTARALGANPARSRAILNGCDTAVFHPRDRAQSRQLLGLPAEGEMIVYVGRLDVRKGLIELIEAVASLRNRRKRLHCHLVGDGPDKRVLLDAIARHDAGRQIDLVPPCPTGQVALWMAAANLFALPSYMEGCPNVVLEALATGCPVVATNVGGIPEIMDRASGSLVPPRDVAALADGMSSVLDRQWVASEISARHSRNWWAVSDEVMDVMLHVLERGPIRKNTK